MKKGILFIGLLGGLFAANAQNTNTTAGPATGNVTLNVNLHPLQSIAVSNSTVNLNYESAANYEEGVSANVAGHLTVFSTGAFKVTVKSTKKELTSSTTGSTPIELADIKIQAKSATGNNISALTFTAASQEVTLSTADDVEIGTGTAGTGTIDVKYTAAGDNAYLQRVVDNTLTTYDTNVLYSIIAK